MTTYYVRKDGNNSGNGTTDTSYAIGGANCAKLTIAAAAALATPGDTVTVHTGTYAEVVSSIRAGSSGNLITIQGYPGETVSVTRCSLTHNYNRVRELRITGSGVDSTSGIVLNGSYCEALYNTLVGNATVTYENINMGMLVSGAYCKVQYNTWTGNNLTRANGFGIGIQLEEGSSYADVGYNTMTGLESPGRLFVPQGTYHTIHHNHIYNIGANYTSGDVHPDILQLFASVSQHNVFECNYVHDIDETQWIMFSDWPGGGGYDGITSDWHFRNNIFAVAQTMGFLKSPYIYIYNNVFYRIGQPTSAIVLFGNDSEGNAHHGQFINNVVIPNAASSSQNVWADAANCTIDYNYYGSTTYAARTGLTGTHNVNGGNPQFTAVGAACLSPACDFHIGATSVLRGAGQNLSTSFTTDYDGNTRTVPWDIGPFGYNLGASTPPVGTPILSVR